ncbi:hypothetical protein SKAU_G00223520 [Synaphobranchus kaupii]|uniref:Apolipoprotein A-IV n=1 Tax=Synaphobranchus kaupii TaxID=118154 RepID=A0A9Q1FBE2_SYNKA|nr:hypothetical protein SKAU_G00223520 [Synaphobranchus kaupii]
MRVFVLLALVAFTGCQANVLRSVEPTPQLDQMKQTFWDYLTNAAQTAKSTLQTIKETELGQQVSAKIEESAFVARQYALVLQDQVSLVGQESFNKVADQVDRLKERLWQDMSEVSAQLEPYTEPLKANIEQKLEKLMQEVAAYTESVNAEALKASLLQRSEELKQSVKELQSQLGSYTEVLKEKMEQRMQEFQQSVTPLAESLQTQLAQKAKMLQQALAPYVEDLRENLDPYAQDLKSRLTSLWESFAKIAEV